MADFETPVAGISVYKSEPEVPYEPIKIYPEAVAQIPIFNDAVLLNRAQRYDFGLGPESPGVEQLRHDTMSGREGRARNMAAAKQDIADLKTRTELLKELAKVREPGSSVTQEEGDLVRSLTPDQLNLYRNDPRSFYERGFAKKVLEIAQKSGYDKMFEQAFKEVNAPKPESMFKATEDIITRQQVFMRLLEEQEAKWSELSGASKLMNFGGTLVPFLSAYRYGDVLKDVSSSLFPGEVKTDAINTLWQLPEKEAIGKAQEFIDELAKRNPLLALEFARNLVSYSTFESLLDSSILVADILTVGAPAIKAGIRGGISAPEAASAMKDLVKATVSREHNPANILEATGNIEGARSIKAFQILHNLANKSGSPSGFYDLRNGVPSAFNPSTVVNGYSGTLGNEAARRVAEMLASGNEQLAKLVVNPVAVNRLTPGSKALGTAENLTDQLMNIQYSRAADAIMDIRTISQSESISGAIFRQYKIGQKPSGGTTIAASLTPAGKPLGKNPLEGMLFKNLTSSNDNIAVQIGQKDATLFESFEAADRAAREEYGLSGYYVKQQGKGYYIEYNKAIREDDYRVWNSLELDTKGKSPSGMFSFISGFTGAGSKRVAKDLEQDWLVATYGATGLQKVAESMMEPVRALKGFTGREAWKDFQKFLERQRDMDHPVTKDRGYFSKTLTDFEKDWLNVIGKEPTEAQAKAYFAYTQASDADWMLRNLRVVKEKSRLGLEMHSFYYNSVENGSVILNKPKPSIEGRVLDSIPWTHPEDAGILIMGKDLSYLKNATNAGEEFAGYFRKNTQSKGWTQQAKQEFIDGLLKTKGYKVIQISDIGEQALRDLAHLKDANGKSLLPKGRINFIVSKDTSSEPLSLAQIPYKPGGHVEYPNGFYVAQPSITKTGEGKAIKHWYSGDNHYMYHPTYSESALFTQRMNTAREMLANNDPNFSAFFQKNLPGKEEQFKALFEGEDALFKLDTPFEVKASGSDLASQKKLADRYQGFTRSTDSAWNIYGESVDLKFLGERNQALTSFRRTGDIDTPAFNFKQSRLVDPITSVNRAFQNLIRDQYMGDLKFKAANEFVAEFGKLIDAPMEAMRKNPMEYLINTPWRKDITADEQRLFNVAKNYRRSTINFIGLQGDFESQVWAWQQKLAGQAAAALNDKTFTLLEPYLLHTVANPNHYVKQITFHSFLGLLNPVPLLQQASTMVNMIALTNPVRGMKAMAKGVMMRQLGLTENPDVINGVAKMAGAWGWKKEHFLESYEALRRTGFGVVGGEHALRDTYFSTPVIFNKNRKYLDYSSGFFNEGERWNRYAAWSAAYDEWRLANPKAAFNDEAISKVLQRANVFSGDMSRASKAWWQQGTLSVSTQFLSFQSRLTEQYWGRDLTRWDRIKSAMTWSTVFGIPAAGGLAAGVLPVGKITDSYARDFGVDVDGNMVLKTLNDGVGSLLAEYIAGSKQNVKERFGAGGVDVFRDIYKGKKSIQEVLGGPSGLFGGLQDKPGQSFLIDTATSLGHLMGVPLDFFSALAKGEPLPNRAVSVQKLIDFTNNFGAGNSYRKLYAMYNLNQFVSKNEEVILSNVDDRQKWIYFLSGLQPQKVSEAYDILADIEARKNAQKEASRQSDKWFRIAFKSPNKEDAMAALEQAQLHLESAGFNAREKAQELKRVTRGKEDRYTQILRTWGMQDEKHFDLMMKKLSREKQ